MIFKKKKKKKKANCNWINKFLVKPYQLLFWLIHFNFFQFYLLQLTCIVILQQWKTDPNW